MAQFGSIEVVDNQFEHGITIESDKGNVYFDVDTNGMLQIQDTNGIYNAVSGASLTNYYTKTEVDTGFLNKDVDLSYVTGTLTTPALIINGGNTNSFELMGVDGLNYNITISGGTMTIAEVV